MAMVSVVTIAAYRWIYWLRLIGLVQRSAATWRCVLHSSDITVNTVVAVTIAVITLTASAAEFIGSVVAATLIATVTDQRRRQTDTRVPTLKLVLPTFRHRACTTFNASDGLSGNALNGKK